jgi:hypothetical protein
VSPKPAELSALGGEPSGCEVSSDRLDMIRRKHRDNLFANDSELGRNDTVADGVPDEVGGGVQV